MKVLIIHQHFRLPEQGGAIRSYYLAKALIADGIEVVVITASNAKKYSESHVEGIVIHYLPIPYDNSFTFWKRSKSFMQFAVGANRLAHSIPSIDLCYAISVPLTTGLIARRLLSNRGIPYIFEVGDLWPDAPIQLGYIKNPLFKKMLLGLERSLYEHANSIVALSPAIKEAVEKKVRSKTVHMIPNMADTDFYAPAQKDEGLEVKFGVGKRFVVSYIGAVGVANGLDYYIECARASMQSGLPVHFLLCGEGALLMQHKENVKRLGLDNFTFIPFQDRNGVQEIMKITDAAFVCYKPFPILETGSPNKYFDGLAAGKLILINFEGWIKQEIEEHQCGVAIDKRRPSQFVNVIEPFLRDGDLLLRYKQASRKLALSHYSRKMLGDRYVRAVRSS